MRISENYDSHTKDELLAEVDARGIEGVTSSSLKADIIAALALDDETHEDVSTVETEQSQPPEPLPPLTASPIPQVPAKDAVSMLNPAQPLDHEYTDGLYVKLDGDAKGETFALCITDPDGYENTHFLKNSRHSWSGKAIDFKQQFDRK